MRTKWSIGLHKSATNDAKISLAAGATLDLGGTNQFVAALSGAGQVRNGTLSAGRLVADAVATSWTDAQGTFAVPENLVVEVKNLPSEITRLDIRILHAASYAGLSNLANATLVGEPIPEGMKARLLVASDGYLTLRVKRIEGLTVIMK